jgi:hypothetical protein
MKESAHNPLGIPFSVVEARNMEISSADGSIRVIFGYGGEISDKKNLGCLNYNE